MYDDPRFRYDPYAPPPRTRQSIATYLWPLLVMLLIAAVVVWRFWPVGAPSGHTNPSAELRVVSPRGELADDEKSVIRLYQQASPSVVHVTSSNLQRDSFTRNVTRIPRGTGSGFIWDNQGRIVTNYHVVEVGNSYQVTLADRSTYPAVLVGVNPSRDLAVLQIRAPADKLRPLRLGESGNLQVGQATFAIGNPFGLDQSLSSGIVSALNREIEAPNGQTIAHVIQTTAPINPGNSGGPLLDSDGRLVGVNTAIVSRSGEWAGIGFAIPVDEVNRVVTQIIRGV
jgi:S1-C subfamily serine protease